MPAALAPDLKEKAEKLFLAGFTPTEIGRQLGVERKTVSTWSKRHQWSSRRDEIRQIAVSSVSAKGKLNRTGRSERARGILAEPAQSVMQRMINEAFAS